jgi:hypothetical protein
MTLNEYMLERARLASLPHRSTEPREVLADVDFEHGAAQHRARKGEIVHVPAGSELEQLYGADNLGPVVAHHRPGAAN